MNTQTEAERLAYWLEQDREHHSELDTQAASELRRLQAEVTEQCRINGMGAERELKLMAELEQERKANAELLDALDGVMYWDNGKPEWETARAAIAKHSKEQA
jgi:hypothetical protein